MNSIVCQSVGHGMWRLQDECSTVGIWQTLSRQINQVHWRGRDVKQPPDGRFRDSSISGELIRNRLLGRIVPEYRRTCRWTRPRRIDWTLVHISLDLPSFRTSGNGHSTKTGPVPALELTKWNANTRMCTVISYQKLDD